MRRHANARPLRRPGPANPARVSRIATAHFDGLVPAKITDVVDGGIAYKVKLDKGEEKSALPFDKITAPLE